MRYTLEAVAVGGVTAALLIGLPPTAAHADVSVGCSVTSLISAVSGAVTAGGTQVIDLAAACTYTLTSVNNGTGVNTNGLPLITNSVNLTINGNGATITRDAAASRFRLFQIDGTATVTLNALILSNGFTPDGASGTGQNGGNGGAIDNAGTLHLNGITVQQNATGAGGSNFGQPMGGSGGAGGGVYNSGTFMVATGTFASNQTGLGGAGYLDTGSRGSGGGIYSNNSLQVTDTTFMQNSGGVGGGIENFGGTATLNRNLFNGNAGDTGGGVSNYNVGTFALTNSTFVNNMVTGNSTGEGGGVWSDGAMTVVNCTLVGNGASSGGGLYMESGTFSVKNTIISGSTSGGNCGGVAITDGGHNVDDGTTCGFAGTNCMNTSGTSFCSTDPMLDPSGLADHGGPTQTVALQAMSVGVDGGDETVCSMTTGSAPVNNLDQRSFVRPGAGHTHCSIGAFEFSFPPTPTPTSTPTVTTTPTQTPTPLAPRITGGTSSGSTVVTGETGNCTPTNIRVFDCGPESPPVCHDGNDTPLTVVGVQPPNAGALTFVTITLAQPLVPGEKIYVTDGCTDPIVGLPVLITAPAPAPLLTAPAVALLAGILGLVGLAGLTPLRHRR